MFCRFKSASNTSQSNEIDSDDNDDEDEVTIIDDNNGVIQEISEDDYDSDGSDENDSTNEDSSSHLVSDESSSASSSDDEDNDEELTALPSSDSNQHRINEETMISIISDSSLLSLAIYKLLQHVRKLVKFIKKSSVLDRYIRQQIRLKNTEISQTTPQQIKSTKLNNVILDFCIRWNTTYLMISRFILLSSIITDITLSPSIECGLKKNQYKNFENFHFLD